MRATRGDNQGVYNHCCTVFLITLYQRIVKKSGPLPFNISAEIVSLLPLIEIKYLAVIYITRTAVTLLLNTQVERQ